MNCMNKQVQRNLLKSMLRFALHNFVAAGMLALSDLDAPEELIYKYRDAMVEIINGYAWSGEQIINDMRQELKERGLEFYEEDKHNKNITESI